MACDFGTERGSVFQDWCCVPDLLFFVLSGGRGSVSSHSETDPISNALLHVTSPPETLNGQSVFSFPFGVEVLFHSLSAFRNQGLQKRLIVRIQSCKMLRASRTYPNVFVYIRMAHCAFTFYRADTKIHSLLKRSLSIFIWASTGAAALMRRGIVGLKPTPCTDSLFYKA